MSFRKICTKNEFARRDGHPCPSAGRRDADPYSRCVSVGLCKFRWADCVCNHCFLSLQPSVAVFLRCKPKVVVETQKKAYALTIAHASEHAQKACLAGTFKLIALARRQPCFALCVQNCTAIRAFWVAEFSGAGFLALRGTKRSQSFRIDEYFNKAEAERLPRKSCSYVRAMVIQLYVTIFSNA